MGTARMMYALGIRAHLLALLEVFVITLISTFPLLLGAMIRWFEISNQQLSFAAYWTALDSFLVRGELFLYALALIAIVVWAALREWSLGLRPPRIVLGLYCFISFGIICTFYTLDAEKVSLHVEAVLVFSKIIFFVTLFFYYFSTLLSKIEPPNLAAILAASSGALAAELGKEQGS